MWERERQRERETDRQTDRQTDRELRGDMNRKNENKDVETPYFKKTQTAVTFFMVHFVN